MKQYRKVLFSVLCALLVTAVIGAGVLHRVDKWVQDGLFQRPSSTSGEIILVGIDEESFSALGPYNTWSRNVIAEALEALAADPDNMPAVTAIDVLYAGNSYEEADNRLAEAAARLGRVVTASAAVFGEEITWENGRAASRNDSAVLGYEPPYDALRDNSTQGHINAMADQDGVMRHALLFVEPDGTRVYSAAFETARLFLEGQGKEVKAPPVDEKGFFYIPYAGRPGDFYDGFSVSRLISGEIPSSFWAGKIVLIGPYAAVFHDAYFTPIDKGVQMYGVEIQANIIQSILEQNFKREVPDQLQLLVLFVLLALSALVFVRLRVGHGAAACAGIILLSFAGAALLYGLGLITHPLWLPIGVLVMYLLSLGAHYVLAVKQRHALELENERISTELSLATRIQMSALPSESPAFPERSEFDLCASMTPAKEVGGDFYDYFLIDEDHLGLVIADVSGKGIPAALFMMVAMDQIRHAAMGEKSPEKALRLVNAQLCSRNAEEMFVTAWLGILELSTGRLETANAGHEYPAIKHADGSFTLLKGKHGLVLGAMDSVRYTKVGIDLEPGAKLFVYTDGLTEATSAENLLFGTERMTEALRRGENGSPEQIMETVADAVDRFVGSAPQFDDLTMLCVRYNGPAAPAPAGQL